MCAFVPIPNRHCHHGQILSRWHERIYFVCIYLQSICCQGPGVTLREGTPEALFQSPHVLYVVSYVHLWIVRARRYGNPKGTTLRRNSFQIMPQHDMLRWPASTGWTGQGRWKFKAAVDLIKFGQPVNCPSFIISDAYFYSCRLSLCIFLSEPYAYGPKIFGNRQTLITGSNAPNILKVT